jgi:6,7-dimethyl-8-ribityllumazine synthase
MLKKIAERSGGESGGIFAIVAAKYNPQFTDALVKSARRELKAGGAERVEVIRVPGAFEVPAVAARLAQAFNPRFDAVICFGAILRGETTHAQQIADSVSYALADIQVRTGVPIIHGVLLFENEEQARVRCLGKEHNRGIEAARVALEMAVTMQKVEKYVSLSSPKLKARVD